MNLMNPHATIHYERLDYCELLATQEGKNDFLHTIWNEIQHILETNNLKAN